MRVKNSLDSFIAIKMINVAFLSHTTTQSFLNWTLKQKYWNVKWVWNQALSAQFAIAIVQAEIKSFMVHLVWGRKRCHLWITNNIAWYPAGVNDSSKRHFTMNPGIPLSKLIIYNYTNTMYFCLIFVSIEKTH